MKKKRDFPQGRWAITDDGRLILGGDMRILDASIVQYASLADALRSVRVSRSFWSCCPKLLRLAGL